VLAGSAAVVVVLAFTTQPTMGAQRSVRIRWQQEQRARQAEISAVQADADSAACQAEQTHE
jgi:hypothetical protein